MFNFLIIGSRDGLLRVTFTMISMLLFFGKFVLRIPYDSGLTCGYMYLTYFCISENNESTYHIMLDCRY